MTIKELAEVGGVSQETIRRTGKRLFPKRFINGVKTELTEKESLEIMSNVKTKNNIAPQNVPQNVQVDYTEIGKMIAMAVTSAMTPILQELRQPQQNQPLQIEHVPEKTSRAIFKQHVDRLVKISKSDWSAVYTAVYAEMGYVYGVKVKARANNRNVRPIDVLESDGLMGKAIAITRQMIDRLEKGID